MLRFNTVDKRIEIAQAFHKFELHGLTKRTLSKEQGFYMIAQNCGVIAKLTSGLQNVGNFV